MNQIQKDLLEQIAGIHEVPQGAYNIRMNGEGAGRNVTENIDIVTKDDKQGIDIIIKPNTKLSPPLITPFDIDTIYLGISDTIDIPNFDITSVISCFKSLDCLFWK